jgi:hypothetical protein
MASFSKIESKEDERHVLHTLQEKRFESNSIEVKSRLNLKYGRVAKCELVVTERSKVTGTRTTPIEQCLSSQSIKKSKKKAEKWSSGTVNEHREERQTPCI